MTLPKKSEAQEIVDHLAKAQKFIESLQRELSDLEEQKKSAEQEASDAEARAEKAEALTAAAQNKHSQLALEVESLRRQKAVAEDEAERAKDREKAVNRRYRNIEQELKKTERLLQEKYDPLVRKIFDIPRKKIESAINHHSSRSVWYTVVVGVIAAVISTAVSFTFGWRSSKSMTGQLTTMIQELRSQSNDNSIAVKDEVGVARNTLLAQLTEANEQVNGLREAVGEVSRSLDGATADLSTEISGVEDKLPDFSTILSEQSQTFAGMIGDELFSLRSDFEGLEDKVQVLGRSISTEGVRLSDEMFLQITESQSTLMSDLVTATTQIQRRLGEIDEKVQEKCSLVDLVDHTAE